MPEQTTLPAEVVIPPFSYRVSQEATDFPRRTGESAEVFGLIDTIKLEVLLSPELIPARTRMVLLHEVLHGILDAAGAASQSQMDLEAMLDCLSSGLLSVLRINPDLVSYLMDDPNILNMNRVELPTLVLGEVTDLAEVTEKLEKKERKTTRAKA